MQPVSHDPKHSSFPFVTLENAQVRLVEARKRHAQAQASREAERQAARAPRRVHPALTAEAAARIRTAPGGGYSHVQLEALELDRVHSNGYAFQIETTYRLLQKGFVAKEVPIVFVDRRAGSSKMNRKIFVEAVLEVWRLRIDAARGRL